MIYGVDIESNIAFNHLPRTSQSNHPVRLNVQRIAAFDKDRGTPLGPCYVQGRAVHIVDHDSYVHVQIDALFDVEFWLSSNQIECRVLDEVPDHILRYWILQQLLPLYLFLNGSTEFLHGMAFGTPTGPQNEDGGSSFPACVAVLGPSYAGKSTLLNYFLSRGHALVTDDHLGLSRQNYTDVKPAIPFYRPYRASEDLGLFTTNYSSGLTRLRQVYLLESVSPTASPEILPLSTLEAISSLVPHLHYSPPNRKRLPSTLLLEDRFRGLAHLARQVPFARLLVPRSLERLPEVYDFIQRELAS